jgi:hypothetical protein
VITPVCAVITNGRNRINPTEIHRNINLVTRDTGVKIASKGTSFEKGPVAWLM